MNQLQKDIKVAMEWFENLEDIDINDICVYSRLSEYSEKNLSYETYLKKNHKNVKNGINKLCELVADEFADIIYENDFTFSEELLVDTIGRMVNIGLKKRLKEMFLKE